MLKEQGLEGIGVLLLYISWVEVVLRRMYYKDLELNKYKIYRLSKEYFTKITLLINMIATLFIIILGKYTGELCIIIAALNSTTSCMYLYSRVICTQIEVVIRGRVLTHSGIQKVELQANRCIITKKDNKKISIRGDSKVIHSIYMDIRNSIDNKE